MLSHTGNCVFFSKTLPRDSDGVKEPEPVPVEAFDFGLGDTNAEIDLGF